MFMLCVEIADNEMLNVRIWIWLVIKCRVLRVESGDYTRHFIYFFIILAGYNCDELTHKCWYKSQKFWFAIANYRKEGTYSVWL